MLKVTACWGSLLSYVSLRNSARESFRFEVIIFEAVLLVSLTSDIIIQVSEAADARSSRERHNFEPNKAENLIPRDLTD